MKKLFINLLAISVLLGFTLQAEAFRPREHANTSGELTADAAVLAATGYFYGISVITDATNAVTMTCYDNASAASGVKLFGDWVVTTSAIDRRQELFPPVPINVDNGIYCDITLGAGAMEYAVFYRAK